MFSAVKTAEPAVPLDVSALLEDRDGRVWVGTLAGLYRLIVPGDSAPTLVRVDLGTPT